MPLFQKAIEKLASGAANAQIKLLAAKRFAQVRLGITTPLYSIRANKDHRLLFTRTTDGQIELLDFVVRSDNAYYRGSER